jgi:hypothetical protein
MGVTIINHYIDTIVIILLIAYAILALLGKILFGKFSIAENIHDYNMKISMSEKYHKMFETRDNLLYHISKAKSTATNYDTRELSILVNELQNLDKVI